MSREHGCMHDKPAKMWRITSLGIRCNSSCYAWSKCCSAWVCCTSAQMSSIGYISEDLTGHGCCIRKSATKRAWFGQALSSCCSNCSINTLSKQSMDQHNIANQVTLYDPLICDAPPSPWFCHPKHLVCCLVTLTNPNSLSVKFKQNHDSSGSIAYR